MARQERLHERFTIQLPVTLVVGETELRGQTENVSLGGLLATVEGTVPFGASVVVKIVLPATPETIELPATVRWSRGSAIGMQFGVLRAKATWALNQLMKKG